MCKAGLRSQCLRPAWQSRPGRWRLRPMSPALETRLLPQSSWAGQELAEGFFELSTGWPAPARSLPLHFKQSIAEQKKPTWYLDRLLKRPRFPNPKQSQVPDPYMLAQPTHASHRSWLWSRSLPEKVATSSGGEGAVDCGDVGCCVSGVTTFFPSR